MDGLLLDRQHGQDVSVEVQTLIMRQNDLVTLKGPGVTQSTRVEVNNMKGVVFQGRSWIWSHRLIVAIHLEEDQRR